MALFTLSLATAFTLFYFLHEQLPRLVRAPSAMLLAPVAIVDGLCAMLRSFLVSTEKRFRSSSLISYLQVLCAEWFISSGAVGATTSNQAMQRTAPRSDA